MNEYIVQGPIGMPRGAALRIDDGCGILVHVREGEVWLTQDSCSQDTMLRSGESFRLDRDGAAIVQSFRRSAVMLTAPQRGGFARSISLTRSGSTVPEVLHQRRRRSPGEALRELRAGCQALWARTIATAG